MVTAAVRRGTSPTRAGQLLDHLDLADDHPPKTAAGHSRGEAHRAAARIGRRRSGDLEVIAIRRRFPDVEATPGGVPVRGPLSFPMSPTTQYLPKFSLAAPGRCRWRRRSGSGLGIRKPYNTSSSSSRRVRDVDAGVARRRTRLAMELGCDAVPMNTAIAVAD
jgi:thiazole synthase ThiGH ThiG subunit